MIATLLVAAAFAQECERVDPPEARLAVAWVSPVRQAVRGGELLPVVPATDLRAFVLDEKPSPGRLLQALGERKKAKDPKRRYKVTIFEVTPEMLCRPIDGADEAAARTESTTVGGVAACGRFDQPSAGNSGCGYTVDRADGSRGFDVYRVAWRDAAAAGFCVLPLDRYLRDVAE